MEYIIISGVKINIKQHGYSEEEILNDFKLRNLLEDVIEQTKKMYESRN